MLNHIHTFSAKKVFIFLLLLLTLSLSACTATTTSGVEFANVPVGKAYVDGQLIYFTHTEASDAGVAEKLTGMMKSPVLHVPSLAKVPAEALAKAYVFQNGVKGKGPFGFQSDVFDSQPGQAGYSPLRNLHMVNWKDESKARELKSASDVLDAEKAGELTIAKTEIVVNMPMITWKDGKR